MAAKDQARAAQLAIALRRGELKREDVPEEDRAAVEDLATQDEDSLVDLTKRPKEMRSEALKRALLESQRSRQSRPTSVQEGWRGIQRLFGGK